MRMRAGDAIGSLLLGQRFQMTWLHALLLFLAACAARAPLATPPTTNTVSAVLRLFGRWHVAHACPVDGVVLTAGHVASPFALIPMIGDQPIGYSWSDGLGNHGYARASANFLYRDLGVLSITKGTVAFYRRADEAPRPGDELRWIEYDFSERTKAYESQARTAQFLREVAGHLVLDGGPMRGASGSCVFNSSNEVVGIVSWDGFAGVVVGVTGDWWPLP